MFPARHRTSIRSGGCSDPDLFQAPALSKILLTPTKLREIVTVVAVLSMLQVRAWRSLWRSMSTMSSPSLTPVEDTIRSKVRPISALEARGLIRSIGYGSLPTLEIRDLQRFLSTCTPSSNARKHVEGDPLQVGTCSASPLLD